MYINKVTWGSISVLLRLWNVKSVLKESSVHGLFPCCSSITDTMRPNSPSIEFVASSILLRMAVLSSLVCTINRSSAVFKYSSSSWFESLFFILVVPRGVLGCGWEELKEDSAWSSTSSGEESEFNIMKAAHYLKTYTLHIVHLHNNLIKHEDRYICSIH